MGQPLGLNGVASRAVIPDTSSKRFHDRCDALPAADALGGESVAALGTRQQRCSLSRDACARGAQRMSQRQTAAVEIYLGLIEAQLADAGQRLRRERFVDFDHI